MMKKHVLIVDDEAAVLMAYKKLLCRADIEIHTAETIEDAEECIAKQTFEVIISDLRLTGTSNLEGLEILRLVRERTLNTKVILMTAYGNAEIRERALKLGASLYLEKPILADDLRRAIGSLEGKP